MLPGPPQDVVADLARRAQEAERQLHRQKGEDKERKPPTIRVRVASQPTFMRYVFDMPDASMSCPTSMTANSCSASTGRSNGIWPTRSPSLPPTLKSINADIDYSSVAINFVLNGKPKVRSFPRNRGNVVDIGLDGAPAKQAATQPAPAAAPAAPAVVPGIAAPDTVPAEAAPGDAKPAAPPLADQPPLAPSTPSAPPKPTAEKLPAAPAEPPKVASKEAAPPPPSLPPQAAPPAEHKAAASAEPKTAPPPPRAPKAAAAPPEPAPKLAARRRRPRKSLPLRRYLRPNLLPRQRRITPTAKIRRPIRMRRSRPNCTSPATACASNSPSSQIRRLRFSAAPTRCGWCSTARPPSTSPRSIAAPRRHS